MLENAVEEFINHLFIFITGENKNARTLLVKKHSDNLQTHGDFSFPNTAKSWHGLLGSRINVEPESSLIHCIGKNSSDFIHESKNWNLPINDVKEVKDRVYIYLERPRAIHVGLSQALRNNSVISQRLLEGDSNFEVKADCEESGTLTYLRVKYLSEAIKNLCKLHPDHNEKTVITVSSKSSAKSNESRISCGAVLNVKSGAKETTISAENFIRMRQNDMTLIAQHKYGVRVSTDSKWKEFIAHLGESAVVFDLLQAKPSGAVKINFECSSAGSSKGAAFILYNCARLETIIRTYNERVDEGVYPPLPDLDGCDLTLLTQEDEWNLIFNYILGTPSLLASCLDIKGNDCEFRPHQICGYLCAMVRVFSQYYRRIRILTEPRKHLLPVIFARMHMLRMLNDTLKTCLRILNIKSVSQM
ncbi:hypothetical protein O3G_MSEX005210 [Manduca sexta]|uniref:DALR anticodon binding domain-containing protein n=1 Tax=Manduca sexta TaxID=7130 RepID=A0A922CJH3_MANSE|nr:hypothetical protein O3G_MSEX005210 [Manduca sexta]